MIEQVTYFVWGAVSMACLVAGLFFLSYWRSTRDRFFVFLALAFWTLAVSWAELAFAHPLEETRHYHYAVRLVAFGLIIAGIVDKNRTRTPP